jgi:ribulose-5-phosphate 4-epimerase/fuculose-1-phosphate aldolase
MEERMSSKRSLSRSEMSNAEWETRCDLAALHRIVDRLGWTDLLQTHLSARIPGEPNAFLINRYGDTFDEIEASGLVKMDLEGNVIGDPARFNQAGATIHGSVYKARPDANCVLHTHTRAGVGVSLLRDCLRPISQDALLVLDEVVYHEYGAPATLEEGAALRESCRKGSCVVLLNHGLLTLGPTIPAAFQRLYLLERACEVELIARSLDEPPVVIAEHVAKAVTAYAQKTRNREDYGVLDLQALQRRLDRSGAQYVR